MQEEAAHPPRENPARVVGRAIQKLAAARLGRGFVPLALLFLLGLGEMLTRAGGFALAAGAPLAAGAMLAYSLRVVQRAFGRPPRLWMVGARLAALVPPSFGVYVVGWLGLRGVAQARGVGDVLVGLVFSVLGAWVLRSWMRLLELHRLAETMALGLSVDEGEEA